MTTVNEFFDMRAAPMRIGLPSSPTSKPKP